MAASGGPANCGATRRSNRIWIKICATGQPGGGPPVRQEAGAGIKLA
jgi:hypothetical protein